MKIFVVFLICLYSTATYSKEDLIEKMAIVVCDCWKQQEAAKVKQTGGTSYISCTLEGLEPNKKSIVKLIKKIIRKDNEGEDLDALDAFNTAFEEAINKNCPGLSFDYSDIFNTLIQ